MQNRKSITQIILSIVILAALIVPIFPNANLSPAKIHPSLIRIADESPDEVVSVIVQLKQQTQDVEALISKIGGDVTHDLGILHAVTAQLPVSSAMKLANEPDVRWMSLDTEVTNSKRKTTSESDEVNSQPKNYYLETLNVQPVWDSGLLGNGVTVAVIDSGVNPEKDLQVNQ